MRVVRRDLHPGKAIDTFRALWTNMRISDAVHNDNSIVSLGTESGDIWLHPVMRSMCSTVSFTALGNL